MRRKSWAIGRFANGGYAVVCRPLREPANDKVVKRVASPADATRVLTAIQKCAPQDYFDLTTIILLRG